MALSYKEQRLQAENIKNRLKALLKHPDNQSCSECGEPKPTWAFILEPPVEGGKKLAALCCYKCYSYPYKLGKSVGTVKSANMGAECKQDFMHYLYLSYW